MIYISDKFISKRLFVFAKKENDKKGAEYLLNAAKKGYPEAQYCLAELYGDGIGVPRSMDQYFFWLRCAQINGNRKAVAELQRWLNSKAGNAVEFDLERIDPQILAHPQYIEVYRIRKEAKKIMEEKDDDD